MHDEEPEERPSTTIEASLAHCLPRLSPFNETSKHRWWQTKTPLSEDASGIRKRLKKEKRSKVVYVSVHTVLEVVVLFGIDLLYM